MLSFSTREAAKKLGLTHASLSRYMAAGKIPTPPTVSYGKFRVHVWTEEDIEKLRKLLPNLPDGRKTRHQQEKKEKKQTKTKTKQKSKP